MKYLFASAVVSALLGSSAGTVVWDGRLANFTATDFDDWSWSNQVGVYQTYIYGNTNGQTASDWLDVSDVYANNASATAQEGIKVTITSDSVWNGGTMRRTELIPQATDSELTGDLIFHVSLLIPSVNQPNPNYEHQIVFWESHVAEIKYGQLNGQTGGEPNTLRFMTNSQEQWSMEPELDTWYNFAFQVGSSGAFYYSEGGDSLTKVYEGSTGEGGQAFHVGQLRLSGDDMTTEEIWYSGVYVEDSLTTEV